MQIQPIVNPPRLPVSEVLPEPARVETEAEDDAMRARLKRLARPHRSGGWVIERATLLAGGSGFDRAVAWIEAHGGTPEMPVPLRAQRGLHSPRAAEGRPPLRYLLPADALR
jgi:hypothetical protein